jgi:pimeloyl-ACP methyl ester carboxylesterase
VVLPGAGHNLPQERPAQFADAVLSLVEGAWPGRLIAGN